MLDNDLPSESPAPLVHSAHPNGAQRTERNRLLRILSAEDYAWISNHLEPVPMKLNDVLAGPNEHFRHVYFAETAVVSVVNEVSGGMVEVGTVGNVGIAGLSAFLDADAPSSKTFVQVPGEGKRIDAQVFAEGVEKRRQMRRVLSLQKAGLIRYVRGRVTVLDRAGLEAASCDCYRIVKSHFDRLLGDAEHTTGLALG